MLTSEEMYVLIEKLMHMHGQLFGYEPRLTQEELVRFLTIEYNRVGADTHITPRGDHPGFHRAAQHPATEPRPPGGGDSGRRGVPRPAAPDGGNDGAFAEFSL